MLLLRSTARRECSIRYIVILILTIEEFGLKDIVFFTVSVSVAEVHLLRKQDERIKIIFCEIISGC